jgi:hypothetical protein
MTANKTMKWMKRIKKKINARKRADSTSVESALYCILWYVFFYLLHVRSRMAVYAQNTASYAQNYLTGAQKHLFSTITVAIKLFFQRVFLSFLAEADTFGSIVLFAPSIHHDFRVPRLHHGPERESGLHS